MKNTNFKTVFTFFLIFLFSFTAYAETSTAELRPRPGYGSSKHRKRGTTKRRACNGKKIFNPKKLGF